MTGARRILLADDEQTFLRSTAALLQREGYECLCASDAATVTDLLQAHAYDVLITDIKMPGNADLELVQQLPHLAAGVPVILVTGYPSLQTAIAAVRLPVVAYLVKPFDFGELLNAVRCGIEQSSAYRAVERFQHRLRNCHQNLESAWQITGVTPEETSPTVDTLFGRSVYSFIGCMTELQRLSGVLLKQHSSLVPRVPQQKDMADLSVLSPQERLILNALLSGQRIAAIARSLSLSVHTVRNHVKSIFRKLRVHSQNELLVRLRWLVTQD